MIRAFFLKVMKTRIVARVIIYNKKKVLLCKNKNADFWYPPGGGWEDNENLVECCKREVAEEVGMKVDIKDIMYVQEFYLKTEDKRNLELFFLAHLEADSGKFLQKNGDKESRWFSREDMATINVKPIFMRDRLWIDLEKFDKNKRIYWKTKEDE